MATAVLIALWTSAGTVAALEIIAAIRAELAGSELLLQVAAGTLMGLAIIALRTLLP